MELRSAELEVAGTGMTEFQEKRDKRQETAMPTANRFLLDKKSKKGIIVKQFHVRRNTEV